MFSWLGDSIVKGSEHPSPAKGFLVSFSGQTVWYSNHVLGNLAKLLEIVQQLVQHCNLVHHFNVWHSGVPTETSSLYHVHDRRRNGSPFLRFDLRKERSSSFDLWTKLKGETKWVVQWLGTEKQPSKQILKKRSTASQEALVNPWKSATKDHY